ncbi:MAG: FtsX-like permease family protein [bacterium]
MTSLHLGIRSALYYWRAHLAAMAGTAIAGAVLVGALLVGDSVSYSLEQAALSRLGGIHYVIGARDRFISQDLADRLAVEASTQVAPVLLLPGMAMSVEDDDNEPRQANNVQVAGVDHRFFALAGDDGRWQGPDDAAINTKLAALLRLRVGDRLSIRVGRPSLFPGDAPLSSQAGEDTVRATFTVVSIVPDNGLGRFGLAANQAVPLNVFVNLRRLQDELDLPGRVNHILAGAGPGGDQAELKRALRNVWRIGDIGLSLREIAGMDALQLESDRIFMDPVVSSAALDSFKSSRTGDVSLACGPAGTLTYLVNSISAGSPGGPKSTPYSFMEGISPAADRSLGVVPAGMGDDEIIINRWLADSLAAGTGQTVTVAYYELTPANKFIEVSRRFRVRGIVEMSEIAFEKDYSPRFPGLTDVERCAEWDIGMPLDKDKIEDKANESYWSQYRATPKAFVTLKAGQEMWANRFGNLSAVRYKADPAVRDALAGELGRAMDPSAVGLGVAPVRAEAMDAAAGAVDFGGLFLGMSIFLIVAALMLTGLMFAFGVQQRAAEVGILLAAGYRPGHVMRLLAVEGCLTAGIGAAVGAVMGMAYTKALVWGLAHIWQGAVANAAVQFHSEPLTVLKGGMACFLCAIASMGVAVRRQLSRPARELLCGDAACSEVAPAGSGRSGGVISVLSWLGIAVALGIVLYAVSSGAQDAVVAFFAAGALLLVSGLGLARELLMKLDVAGRVESIAALGVRNADRRRARSLTVVAMLACGCFMVFAVSAMREDPGAAAGQRASGTGGFELVGESTIPLQADLNTPAGRKRLKLDGEQALNGVAVVPVKVRDGDDASCLNLNRAQSPRLLGIDPGELARRNAFARDGQGTNLWSLLDERLPDGVVPGLAGDGNTAMWGLKKKVGRHDGDTLVFQNERGEDFRVRLVGTLPMRLSVFQGSVLISHRAFTTHYPSISGHRMFLFDVAPGGSSDLIGVLTGRLGRLGLDLTPAVDRLREFYTVEATYMGMFLVLGGLGLLLGSAGMGIVVMRNIQERRGELALLKAVGYSDSRLSGILLVEHMLLLALGLSVGLASSLVAMWPSLASPGVTLPYWTMLLLSVGIAATNMLCIIASIRIALHGSPVDALRSE